MDRILADGSIEVISKESLAILYFVLPGLVAAWVFYGLTAHPKQETFERIVQALIFTIFVKAMNIITRKLWWILWHPHFDGMWTDGKELVFSLANAVLLGVFVAVCSNWDVLHCVLRKVKATTRTSYPSEWYSCFHRSKQELVLHLKDKTRVKGWPEEWPDQCDKGHFIIHDPSWLDASGKEYRQTLVERLMLPAIDVAMVEFWYNVNDPEKLKIVEAERKALAELHKESDDGKQGSAEKPSIKTGSPGPDTTKAS